MKSVSLLFAVVVSLFAVTAFAQETTTAAMSAEVKVCTEIVDRMPVGEASSFPASVGQVFVWSRITGGASESTVKHVYSHNGTEVASVELRVNGSSWRTWSSKSILPSWTGDWEVKVVDASGATIGSASFTISASETETAPADSTPPDSTK